MPATENRSFEKEIELSERGLILELLQKYNWNKGKTAAALKINRTTLWRKMKKFGLNPTDRSQNVD